MKMVLFFVAVLLATLTGCGLVEECDLSGLKIKSVKIDGDKGDYIARAIKAHLYRYGAKADLNGSEIVGAVVTRNESTQKPLAVAVEVPNDSFSGTGYAGATLYESVAIENIARTVALDFCTCARGQNKSKQ